MLIVEFTERNELFVCLQAGECGCKRVCDYVCVCVCACERLCVYVCVNVRALSGKLPSASLTRRHKGCKQARSKVKHRADATGMRIYIEYD